MSADKKKTSSLYMLPEQAQRLRRLSRATGKPMAAFVRDGIDHVLAESEARFKPELARYDERLRDEAAAAFGDPEPET